MMTIALCVQSKLKRCKETDCYSYTAHHLYKEIPLESLLSIINFCDKTKMVVFYIPSYFQEDECRKLLVEATLKLNYIGKQE